MVIDAVIAMHSLTKEFEGVKEYEQLTKFIVSGHQQDWISIDDEKAEASNSRSGLAKWVGVHSYLF